MIFLSEAWIVGVWRVLGSGAAIGSAEEEREGRAGDQASATATVEGRGGVGKESKIEKWECDEGEMESLSFKSYLCVRDASRGVVTEGSLASFQPSGWASSQP